MLKGEKVGAELVNSGLITGDQLMKAGDCVVGKEPTASSIPAALIKLGYIKVEDLVNFLSKQYGVSSIDLARFEIDSEIIKLVPREVAEKHICIPVNISGSTLILAVADPSDIFVIDDVKFLTGYNVEVVVASETAIKAAIRKYYSPEEVEGGVGVDEEPDLKGDSEEYPGVVGIESAKGAYLCILKGKGCELLEGGGLFLVSASDMGEVMEQLQMLRREVPASIEYLNIRLISVSLILAKMIEQNPNLRKELARLLR